MIKPKVWLVQNGHAPAGYENKRGKMPRAYKDLIEAAVLNGAQIEGFALTASTGPVEAPTTPARVDPAPKSNAGVIAELHYRYSEDDYVAREVITGKLRSLREACRHCRCSVLGCWCPSPEIVALDARGNVAITVEKRSGN